MQTIIQLSDLHFGSNDVQITERLRQVVTGLLPDILIVSGDLTTRARTPEFKAAKTFLEQLPGQQIIVPGNHDISLYNVIRRFFKPLKRFQRYLTDSVESHIVTPEVLVIGLNSSRSLTIKGGRISTEQINKVRKLLEENSAPIKIIATHHPLGKMSRSVLEQLASLGVNVFVSGHNHVSSSDRAVRNIQDRDHHFLLVQAGTATSVRYRNEPNSFNRLLIEGCNVTVETYTWEEKMQSFERVRTENYDFTN